MTGINLGLNDSVGCIFLAAMFASILYGCCLGQVVYYFRNFGREDKHIKYLATVIWALDTVKTVSDAQIFWYFTVTLRGNALALIEAPMTKTVLVEFTAAWVNIFIVQCCFIYTTWKLTKGKKYQNIIVIPPLVFSLAAFASSISDIVIISRAATIATAMTNASVPGSLRPGCSIVVDLYITATLCYVLRDAMTGHQRSDNIMTYLINFAITRGLCTAVVQIMSFSTYFKDTHSNTMISIIFHGCSSPVYINSLFAVWNVRRYIRESSNDRRGRDKHGHESIALVPVWSPTTPSSRQSDSAAYALSAATESTFIGDGGINSPREVQVRPHVTRQHHSVWP